MDTRKDQKQLSRRYLTRIVTSSNGWKRPAGEGEAKESASAYRSTEGFGHEEWLFRDEWQLDGWRYGYVQGVNKSRKKLLREDVPFDLQLFTVSPGQRRIVCEILDVECLSDDQAKDALAAYRDIGWLRTMVNDVKEAGGRHSTLSAKQPAHQILNLRYRLRNVRRFDDEVMPGEMHPASWLNRYQLYLVDESASVVMKPKHGPMGKVFLEEQLEIRKEIAARTIICSPEHNKMQRKLGEILKRENPFAKISFEDHFVDVKLESKDRLVLFEIKSDLRPLTVIRESLGQLLEYAYHPRNDHATSPELVIVGRRPLEGDDLVYFNLICEKFLPNLNYLVIDI